MRPLPPRVLALACVAVLLAAGAGLGLSLRAPDPRGRTARAAAPIVLLPGAPQTWTLYLPSCDVTAVRVHAGAGAGGPVDATVTAGQRAITQNGFTSIAVPAGGHADIPVTDAPARQRVTLTLAARDGSLALQSDRPFELRASDASLAGLLPCAIGAPRPIAWIVAGVMALHLIGFGVLAAYVAGGGLLARARPRDGLSWHPALAAVLAGTTVVAYAALVPPFEPPDEMAHLQYARFVATTGGLPTTLPPEDEWRGSAYEWVQQPGYYLVAAAVLQALGDPSAAPTPQRHPESLIAGGPDIAIYQHPDETSPPGALYNVWLLRVVSVLMAMLAVWWTALAIRLATGDARLALAAAACLGLVHQWAAVMGSVSTDPPATAAAAAATWLLCRYLHKPAHWPAALVVGLVTGLACAMKITAAFLLPMMAVALVIVAGREGWRPAWRSTAAYVVGVTLAAGWIPLRAWLVFGDPLARAFKREVLALGGFVVLDRPPIFSLAFADELRRMVFEPFWARFGSLGAGPLPGTRLWWIYGAATLVLIVLATAGITRAAGTAMRAVRRRQSPTAIAACLMTCTAGVGVGLGLWAWINLVPQDDVIVHWTPRHILPLTTPLLVMAAAGLQTLAGCMPPTLRVLVRRLAAAGVLVLAVAGLAVLRSVILGFHFGV